MIEIKLFFWFNNKEVSKVKSFFEKWWVVGLNLVKFLL